MCLPYRVQQRDRIKRTSTVSEHRLGILAHIVTSQQTIAGCGRRYLIPGLPAYSEGLLELQFTQPTAA